MAGIKGMHSRLSTSPSHAAAVRERIRASEILQKLEDHILTDSEMKQTQVTAALGLLRKVVPDMSENKTELDAGGGLLELLAGLGRSKSDDPPVA